MDPMSVVGGISSLYGMFSGGKAKVDTSNIVNAGNDYLNYAKNNYGDPNSSYYNTIGKKQFNNLNDMYIAGMNKSVNQMYASGVAPSAKVTGDYTENANKTAGEEANQFQTDMYGKGMGVVADAYKSNIQAVESSDQIQAGVDENNAKNSNERASGFTGLGLNMLGQYFQSINGDGESASAGKRVLPLGGKATASLYSNYSKYQFDPNYSGREGDQ